jgi:hypothetical protein
MNLILFVVAGTILGYTIPVLTSLFFSLAMGRVAPRFLAQGGRLQPAFVAIHGLVWTLASLIAGYLVASIMPDLRWIPCLGAAALLIAGLMANADEMKKQQDPLRIGGMILGTVAGFAVGLILFVRMAKSVPS